MLLALKYPDYYTWRDTKTIRNGYWPDGSMIRISDPEFKPGMDDLHEKFVTNKKYRDKFLKEVLGDDYESKYKDQPNDNNDSTN